MTASRHPIASALVLLAVLVAMSSATAQSPLPQTSTALQARIEKSAELQRQALQSLGDVGRAERLTNNAYAELQAALSTIIIKANGAKFQDPLYDIQKRRSEQALALLQLARDAFQNNRQDSSPAKQEEGQPVRSSAYLDIARSNLEQALRLTSTLVF